MSVTDRLQQQLEPYREKKRWLVGLSGGLDSVFLLHTCYRQIKTWQSVDAAPVPELCAVHVNHGLSRNSTDWQRHCEQLCSQLAIPLTVEHVSVNVSGKGLEDAARAERYAVYEALLETGDLLLLGHHLDDQAETFLLRSMRSSGVAGLAAIPATRAIAGAELFRPLLPFSREQLLQQAKAWQLSWVEDESNSDLRYDRNWLRHHLIPELKQRWSQAPAAMARSAELCSQADALLAIYAEQDLAQCDPGLCWGAHSLDISWLQSQLLARVQHIVRYWLQSCGLPVPGYELLLQMCQQVKAGRPDSKAALRWHNLVCRFYRQRIYVFSAAADIEISPKTLSANDGSLAFDAGQVSWSSATAVVGFQLRQRKPGDKVRLSGGAGHYQLKKLMHDLAVPPWWRHRVPLLVKPAQGQQEAQIIALAGLWLSPDWRDSGLQMRWQLPAL